MDNVAITAGAGTTVATDDVAGVHYQRVKLVDGTADSAAAIPGDATYGLDVDVTRLPALPAGANAIGSVIVSALPALPAGANAIGSVTVSGSVAVTGTFWQATQPISAAALPLPTGAATAALQGGGLPAALGASGGLKVDGSGTALPVSAASLPLPAGAATAALQGGGLPAALGAGGGLKVDGSGTALAVSAASLPLPTGAATETTLAALDAKVTACNTGAVVVSGALPAGDNNIGNVDVVTLPALPAGTNLIGKVGIDQVTANANEVVVKSALPAGTNAIGKLAANSGVDIGDVDVTSLPATPAGTNLIGKVAAGLDTTNLYDGATALTITRLAISKNASGANELVAADATKKIRVLAMMLYAVGTANSAYLASAATAIFGGSSAAIPLDKTGATGPAGFALAFNPAGWCETVANEALNLYLSAAQYVGGVLVYTKL